MDDEEEHMVAIHIPHYFEPKDNNAPVTLEKVDKAVRTLFGTRSLNNDENDSGENDNLAAMPLEHQLLYSTKRNYCDIAPAMKLQLTLDDTYPSRVSAFREEKKGLLIKLTKSKRDGRIKSAQIDRSGLSITHQVDFRKCIADMEIIRPTYLDKKITSEVVASSNVYLTASTKTGVSMNQICSAIPGIGTSPYFFTLANEQQSTAAISTSNFPFVPPSYFIPITVRRIKYNFFQENSAVEKDLDHNKGLVLVEDEEEDEKDEYLNCTPRNMMERFYLSKIPKSSKEGEYSDTFDILDQNLHLLKTFTGYVFFPRVKDGKTIGNVCPGFDPDKQHTGIIRIDSHLTVNEREISALFDERPIWTANEILSKIKPTSNNKIKHIAGTLVNYAYFIPEGAWAGCFVRLGYDPRLDKRARWYQQITFDMELPKIDPSMKPHRGIAPILFGFPLHEHNKITICDIRIQKVRKIIESFNNCNTKPDSYFGWYQQSVIDEIIKETTHTIKNVLGLFGNWNQENSHVTDKLSALATGDVAEWNGVVHNAREPDSASIIKLYVDAPTKPSKKRKPQPKSSSKSTQSSSIVAPAFVNPNDNDQEITPFKIFDDDDDDDDNDNNENDDFNDSNRDPNDEDGESMLDRTTNGEEDMDRSDGASSTKSKDRKRQRLE